MSPSRSPLRTIALEPGVELRRGQPLTLNEEGLAVPAGQGDELLGTGAPSLAYGPRLTV